MVERLMLVNDRRHGIHERVWWADIKLEAV
jgi:hypothetical protein